nr:54s ribosomal protein l35, mitochondrial [Quercus suber]
MSKPIYRHLARLKWESYKRKLLIQRITQMHVVPDVFPEIEPVVSTSLSFKGKNVQHGDIVLSSLSEGLPKMDIQCYDKGERLITIAVVNPDVPDVAKDGFNYRCHFLASNIPISPTSAKIDFSKLGESQVIQEWLPAYAQKGTPYQRMSILIFDQGAQHTLDVSALQQNPEFSERLGFRVSDFAERHGLKAIGVDLFRTQWDDYTADVMKRADIIGWDVEFKRMKVEPLPYKRRDTERYR